MKYYFRSKIPVPSEVLDVLVIESGSPEVARRALDGIRGIFPDARFRLCTCQDDLPAATFASVYRVTDYPGALQKLRLLFSFRQQGWKILAILCTGEPILWRWKMLALATMPAKVLIVNENADFFWLDWENRRTLRRLIGNRWGVHGGEFFDTLLRALLFPLTLIVLLSTAGFLLLRRAWRLALWRFHPRRAR